jgi:hypothetical protein
MDYKPDLSPEQKLDMVLQYVVNLGYIDFLNRDAIAAAIDGTPYIKEISEILIKLTDDRYITTSSHMGLGTYISNFDGRMFIDNGGYTAKALRDAEVLEQKRIDAARLIQLESQNLINSNRLNTLTHRLVVGTIAAAIVGLALLLWQVYVFYHPEPIPIDVKIKTEKKV